MSKHLSLLGLLLFSCGLFFLGSSDAKAYTEYGALKLYNTDPYIVYNCRTSCTFNYSTSTKNIQFFEWGLSDTLKSETKYSLTLAIKMASADILRKENWTGDISYYADNIGWKNIDSEISWTWDSNTVYVTYIFNTYHNVTNGTIAVHLYPNYLSATGYLDGYVIQGSYSLKGYSVGTSNSDIINSINGLKDSQTEQVETSKGIWGTVKSIFTTITNLPGYIWNAIKGGFSAITDGLSSLGNVIGNFFSDLGQGIINLGTAILDGIKNLFIPSNEEMSTLMNDFKGTMNNKLGAVGQVVTSVTDFFGDIDWNNSKNTIHLPEIKIMGEMLLKDQNIQVIPSEFGFLQDMVKTIVDIIVTLGFMNMLYSKYKAFVGGDTRDY